MIKEKILLAVSLTVFAGYIYGADVWEITFFGQQQSGGTFVSSPVAHCASLPDGKLIGYRDHKGKETKVPSEIVFAHCEYINPNYLYPWRVSYHKKVTCDVDLASGACLAAQSKGAEMPMSCAAGFGHDNSDFVGNPIKLSVGNKFQKEVIFEDKGLVFSILYNSLDGSWRSSFSSKLVVGSGFVTLLNYDGKEVYFRDVDGEKNYFANGDGILIHRADGWVYYSPDKSRYRFDEFGYLLEVSNVFGSSALSKRDDVTVVTAGDGRSLLFEQGENGQLLKFSTAGLIAAFSYSDQGQLISVSKTVNGQTQIRKYHYEVSDKPSLLTGITDERGVRFATWSYDDQDRAISSEHAGGADKVTLEYNADGSTTVTNELGKKATYRFQVIQGVKRIVAIEGEPSPNCPSSNSTFTYDERGLLKTKTDNKGYVTTYSYNDRGLEISRTEASGTAQARTTTTDWHPTLFLPETVTEPGRITHYQYDDQGRQLSQTIESL
ncbi:RHS repeat protein [Pseudomonas sp. LRF_L74]|uniref:RHS repeat protein n=1 Tax=Pseudomonas sp. LRF_L74 TaxID=3369422 RepID=UPI003F60752F